MSFGVVGVAGAAAAAWIAYQASLSVTNLLLALVLGAVAALVVGSAAAIKIGHDALRKESTRAGTLATAIGTFVLGWAGIALAAFILTLLESSIQIIDGLN